MQFKILEKKDLAEIIATKGARSIWQMDPLIGSEVANKATKSYLNRVLTEGRSVAFYDRKELVAFIIGSVPKWDTDFFGFNSYIAKAVWFSSQSAFQRLLTKFEECMTDWKIKYGYVKIPAALKETIRIFENKGYSLADLRMTFNKKLVDEKPFPTNTKELVFELATKEDYEPIAELSKEVSKIDRFHSDLKFSQDLADELYYRWVINGFAAGKDCIKCIVDGELAGFHMSYPETSIKIEDYYPLSISDIMGVFPRYGGRGIGSGLFVNYFGLAKQRGQKSVIAGVHLDNIISIRLHEGVGFKAIHTEIGLSKWY